MILLKRRERHSGIFCEGENGSQIELLARYWPKPRVERLKRVAERNEFWDSLTGHADFMEKVARAREQGMPLPVSGGMYRARWDLSLGYLAGYAGGWEIDDMPIVDFGAYTVPATTGSVRSGYDIFPLVNPFTALGSPDIHPFQVSTPPGTGTLAVVTGDRQVGTGAQGLIICAGCFVAHVTSAGAVFQPPATATLNLQVMSSNGATAGAYTTEATLNLTTAANIVDQVPIVATTGRTVAKVDGVVVAGTFMLFDGDHCVMNLTNTNAAALAVGGNTLFVQLELL